MMIEIRKAKECDCKELAIIKKQVWTTTYLNIYPKEKINAYQIEKNENKFKQMIREKKQELYVVMIDQKIIGYFSVGEILRPFQHYTHDIGLIYLLKEYQGNGIGTMIFTFCKEKLLEKGITEFIISCNKYNNPAQRFYKKMGGTMIHTDLDQEDRSQPQVKFLYSN